jgi:predicted DNA-binding ribbon-helix-helix protein
LGGQCPLFGALNQLFGSIKQLQPLAFRSGMVHLMSAELGKWLSRSEFSLLTSLDQPFGRGLFFSTSAQERPTRRFDTMKSPIAKRSVLLGGRKTSISLEGEFWTGLKEIAAYRERTLGELVAEIDSSKQAANLSSAIRLFVLQFYQNLANQPAEGRSVQKEPNKAIVWEH